MLGRPIPQSGGGGGETLIKAISGFTAANYLASGLGTLVGSQTMTLGVLAMLPPIQPGGATAALVSHGTVWTEGYKLRVDALRPAAEMADGNYTVIGTGGWNPSWVGGAADAEGAPAGTHFQFANFKHVMMVLRRDGDALSLFVNGIRWSTVTLDANPGFTPGSSGLFVGVNESQGDPWGGSVAGIGYVDTDAMTDAEILEWTRTSMDALHLTDPGLQHLYSFAGYDDGPAPAQIPDEIGAVPLSLVGALTIRSERPRWL